MAAAEKTESAPERPALEQVPHDREHNLYQRLNAAQREVAYLKTDKRVDGKYNVATYDNLIAHARDALIRHGIHVETSLIPGSGKMIEKGKLSSSGAPWCRYEAEYEVRMINVDKPDDRSVICVSAHAEDPGDKAPGKAQTYATKAVLKKELLLETGDDEEGRAAGPTDEPPGAERMRPQAKSARAPTTAPAATATPAAAAAPSAGESKPATGSAPATAPGPPCSASKLKFVRAKLKELNYAENTVCERLGIKTLEEITDKEATTIIGWAAKHQKLKPASASAP